MASQVTNYKCPACTGPLHFSGKSGKLECDYCGSSYDVKDIEAMYADQEAAAAAEQARADRKDTADQNWNAESAGGDWGAEGKRMKAYSCPSCGAQLICDQTTAATSCPYCGNPTVVPGQFGGTKKPDFVLPFKLDKKSAVAALKQHYKGKVLLPKTFKDENHLEEVKGVYVPFWLFDGETEGDMAFHATRTHTHREGDYRVTNTEHYSVHRHGNMAFERIPVDGSSKMPDDYMDSIEPYDYGDLKEFSTAYLPGFLADKYDVTASDAVGRADRRCKETTKAWLRDSVQGYTMVNLRSEHIDIKQGQVRYALMPVWLLSTKWKDKTYLFAMNGQTGKMVGDLPIDKGKSTAIFWSVFVGASAVLSLLLSGPLGRMLAGFFS